jgi:hypothetical protein
MTRPYLCQPSLGDKSCGACCGLYNFHERSLEALHQRLTLRTQAVQSLGLEDRSRLARWAHEEHQRSREQLLVKELPTCHFVGFLPHGGVGCLLHPLVTGGVDLRDLGVYQDRNICENFLCPSFEWLKDEELTAVLSATVGWYDYGLCVTDVEILREVCRFLTSIEGRSFDTKRLLKPEAIERLAEVFAWKVAWPFRDTSRRFGTFDVERQRGLEIPRATIDYGSLGLERSRFDTMFLCLESVFQSASQVKRAEALIEDALLRLSRVV